MFYVVKVKYRSTDASYFVFVLEDEARTFYESITLSSDGDEKELLSGQEKIAMDQIAAEEF